MDDLESRLDHELSALGRTPLADAVPVEELRSRARRSRVNRGLRAVVAVAAAVAVIVGVVAVTRNDSPSERHVRVSAPGFVLGDIDAVVQSSTFDEDGARNPLPAGLTDVVAHVPGVERVTGVIDTFAPLVGAQPASNHPPRTTIVFSYHQPDEINLTSGRLPQAADETIVDAEVLRRSGVALGATLSLDIRGVATPMRIVGTFGLPDLDVTGIPLAAVAAAHQPAGISFDRIDVKLAADADAANVRDRIATAIGNAYRVTPPLVISIPDQRLAQLEIQHAYWALLSPDVSERSTAVAGPRDPEAEQKYRQHYQETLEAELRVEDVHFLSPDEATLTYRVFFGGGPSPIVNAPQAGAAVRIDGVWKLTSATVCALAKADGLTCPTPATSAATEPTRP